MVGLSDADTNNYLKVLEYKFSLNCKGLQASSNSINQVIITDNQQNAIQEKVVNQLHQKQKILTGNEIKQLIAGYKNGKSMKELAKQFGCHRITVSNKLKSAGITLRDSSPNKEQIDRMVLLYKSGLSLLNVGMQVGVSARSVLRNLQDRAVETRDTRRQPKDI